MRELIQHLTQITAKSYNPVVLLRDISSLWAVIASFRFSESVAIQKDLYGLPRRYVPRNDGPQRKIISQNLMRDPVSLPQKLSFSSKFTVDIYQ